MLRGVGNFQGGGFLAAIEVVDYIIHKLVVGSICLRLELS